MKILFICLFALFLGVGSVAAQSKNLTDSLVLSPKQKNKPYPVLKAETPQLFFQQVLLEHIEKRIQRKIIKSIQQEDRKNCMSYSYGIRF